MKPTLALVAAALCVAAALEAPAQAPQAAPPPTAATAAAPAPVPPAPAPQAAAPAPAPTAPPTPRTFYAGARITFDGKAATPGAVGIDFQQTGGTPKVVWVRVLAKTKAGDIAEEVAKELTFAAGGAYKVKASGGRVTIQKANKTATPVSVNVAGLSIYGVSVLLEEY